MQLSVLQSAGRRTDAGQLRRSKVHRAHRSRATPCVDALGRKPPHATEPPGTARRYLTRSRATPCVDAFRRHPPHASKPPGMARRYLNRSRATPCVDALCRHPPHASKPPGMARRYRNAYRIAVEPKTIRPPFGGLMLIQDRTIRRRSRTGSTAGSARPTARAESFSWQVSLHGMRVTGRGGGRPKWR